MKLPMEVPRSAQATPEISSHITRISPPAPPPAAAGEDDVALGVGTTGGVDTSSPLRPSDSRKRRGYVIGIGRGVDTEYEQPEPTPEWWRTCCVQSTCRVHEENRVSWEAGGCLVKHPVTEASERRATPAAETN